MFRSYPPCPVPWPKNKNNWFDYAQFYSCYIILMGAMGFLMSSADIVIISKEEFLPSFMKRSRIRGLIATPREERDLKIVAATLTSFFYILLSFGVYYDYIFCVYPYLIMQSLMISGEILIFLLRLNNNYEFCIRKEDLFCALFAILNWKIVFNYLQRKTMDSYCCFT